MTARDRETAIAYLTSVGLDVMEDFHGNGADMKRAIAELVERFADVREEARAEALEEAAKSCEVESYGWRAAGNAYDYQRETDNENRALDAASLLERQAGRIRSLKPRSGT